MLTHQSGQRRTLLGTRDGKPVKIRISLVETLDWSSTSPQQKRANAATRVTKQVRHGGLNGPNVRPPGERDAPARCGASTAATSVTRRGPCITEKKRRSSSRWRKSSVDSQSNGAGQRPPRVLGFNPTRPQRTRIAPIRRRRLPWRHRQSRRDAAADPAEPPVSSRIPRMGPHQ